MSALETHLRAVRDKGQKSLVAYLMAGSTPNWLEQLDATIAGGADAIEVGIPFSDPMMDGVVIQAAALAALERATTMDSICGELTSHYCGVPLVAMTYYNIFHHYGLERSVGRLADAGIGGAIVPDLTLEEAGPWRAACGARDVATIFMVAPSTTPDRFVSLAGATQGFCYAAARMAVTGRASGGGDAARVVQGIRDISDVPTLVGIGLTSPEQAREAADVSDGVIVGSVLVDAILKGATPAETESLVASFRRAIDE